MKKTCSAKPQHKETTMAKKVAAKKAKKPAKMDEYERNKAIREAHSRGVKYEGK